MVATTTSQDRPIGREFERVRDIVRRTRLSRTYVYDVLRRGEIQTVKVGRTILVERGAFDAYLADRAAQPGPTRV